MAMAMPMATPTRGCIALFDCFDDGASPDESVGVVGRVEVLVELVRIMVADTVLVWLVVARLMMVYEAAE